MLCIATLRAKFGKLPTFPFVRRHQSSSPLVTLTWLTHIHFRDLQEGDAEDLSAPVHAFDKGLCLAVVMQSMYRVDRLASYLGGIEIEIANCMNESTLLALNYVLDIIRIPSMLHTSHQYPSMVHLSRGWIVHGGHIIVSHALSSSNLLFLHASSLLKQHLSNIDASFRVMIGRFQPCPYVKNMQKISVQEARKNG